MNYVAASITEAENAAAEAALADHDALSGPFQVVSNAATPHLPSNIPAAVQAVLDTTLADDDLTVEDPVSNPIADTFQ